MRRERGPCVGEPGEGGVHTVGDHHAGAAGEHEDRFARHAGRHGWRWPVSPSALIWRTPCSKPHTAIDAATIANLIPSDSVQLDPAGDHRAGEVAVPDEEHVAGLHVRPTQYAMARSARSLTCCELSPPGQPCVHTSQSGTVLPDLLGGQALVVAVIPFGQIGETPRRR